MSYLKQSRHYNVIKDALEEIKVNGEKFNRDYPPGSREAYIQNLIERQTRLMITPNFYALSNQKRFDKILLLIEDTILLFGESKAGQNQRRRMVKLVNLALHVKEPPLGIPEKFRQYIPEAFLRGHPCWNQ
ncbi:MAG: hypothetical protein AABX54_02950 [Nanoarchaeota archaeon]